MLWQGMEVIAVHHQRSPKEAANQGILLDAILADVTKRISSAGAATSDTTVVTSQPAAVAKKQTAPRVPALEPEPELEPVPRPEPEPVPRPEPAPKSLPKLLPILAPAPAPVAASPPTRRTATIVAQKPLATVGVSNGNKAAATATAAMVADVEEARRLAKIRNISARPASASPRLRTSVQNGHPGGAGKDADDAEEARLRRIREIASRPKSARARLPP